MSQSAFGGHVILPFSSQEAILTSGGLAHVEIRTETDRIEPLVNQAPVDRPKEGEFICKSSASVTLSIPGMQWISVEDGKVNISGPFSKDLAGEFADSLRTIARQFNEAASHLERVFL